MTASLPPWLLRVLSRWALLGALATPVAFALNPTEKPADYIAAHWDTEDGLPHNSVKAIHQTRDGYLWIGTNYGLARFDGLAFTVFTKSNTPGFVGNYITSLAETSDGSLWIGTSEGLVRHRDGRFTSFTTADGIRSVTINAVCVAPDGSLWIGGRSGITRFVDGKFINDLDTSAYDTTALRTITVDRENNVWIASGSFVLRYRNGSFTAYGRDEGIATNRVERIGAGPEGRVLAVTQSGLLLLEGERFVPFADNQKLSSPRLGIAISDSAGNLWVGSGGGLDRINDGKVVPYLDRHGRKFGVVDVLLEDREGCLWVGAAEGLYRLTDRRAYTLTSEDNPTPGLVTAVKQTRDGSLWIGNWGHGVDRLLNGELSHYTAGAPLSHEIVTKIYEAPDGTLWLGNRGSSIDRLEGDTATTYVYESGVATSRPVTALLADDDGTLLIGIDKRGLLQLSDGKIVAVPELSDWAKNWSTTPVTVLSLHRTHDGKILMGTTRGLFRRRPDHSWEPLAFPELPGVLVVRSVFEDPSGTFWFATDGLGLVRWENGRARAFRATQGMIDDTLFSVVDDERGSFWVSSSRGIARIRKTEFSALNHPDNTALRIMRLGRVDGLLSGSPPGNADAGVRLTDGRMAFATDQGVAIIDPGTLQANGLPPPVVIERIAADDQTVDFAPAMTLPAGTQKLEVRYTALSLIAPERLGFRYKLDGSDAHWVEAGRERIARYTHLAPGSYTFHVLACNNDGVWNQTGARFAVTLLPLFYQTLWFRLIATAAIVVGVALLVWLRLRQLHRRQASLSRANAELDQRVRERTAELSHSHAELQQRELLFRLIFEHAPVGISWKRTDLSSHYHFNPTFCRILDLPDDTLPDYSLLVSRIHPEDLPRHAEAARRLQEGRADNYSLEKRFILPGGRIVWTLMSAAVIRDASGQIVQEIRIVEDITSRKKSEQELADTYKNLVDVSRTAGMAEVATGVLHNVGNVLNSLNVSATIVSTGLRQSKVDSLAKLSALLKEHTADLAGFLTLDPKGRRVPEFIDSLARHFVEERERLLAETLSLQGNVDHIKDIVSMQQAYATMVSVIEPLDPVILMEDALRMNAGALVRHGSRVARAFRPAPPVIAEKAKVLQILLNLIRNAKYACDDGGATDKVITLAIEPIASDASAPDKFDRVRLVVRDNGIGIPAENLTRIFGHGFTTRKTGHGFGLHSAANAAKEMKGTLTVHSDGHGKGAAFTLELPALTEDMVSPHEDAATPDLEPAEVTAFATSSPVG